MTRNFNNSRRDGAHSSARNYSASRPGDRRFSRPPRPTGPRPHRVSMDQAWEEGAAPKHADYRARTPQRPSSQRNSRNHQPSEHSPTHNGSRPFGNRQNNSQRFDRSPRSNSGNYEPRSRSFGPDRRAFDERRDDGRRGYADGPNRKGQHSDFRDNRDREQRFEYRERERTYERGPSQRGPKRFDRQPRDFEQSERFPRNRKDNRQPDTNNPRWQSRPPAQRNNEFRRSPNFVKRTPAREEAQFEGDYERFHDADAQPEERHVTRMPDGRVLKGSRHAQRRQARFWTDVANETEDLVKPAKPPQANPGKPAQHKPSPKAGTAKTARKQHAHKASAVVREKKSKGRPAPTKAGSTVLKPSQRGFKWPTHEQA